MRRLAIALALAALSMHPLDREDSRNVEIPHPKYRFDFQPPASLDLWKVRKEALRKQILTAAGLNPMFPRAKVPIDITRKRTTRQFRIWTLLVETLPGFFVGAELYLPPVEMKGPYPAVLSPHGHWKQGRLTHREDYSVPSLGINLAAQGYIVIAWDMVGYGDARQLPHDSVSQHRQLWGMSPLGLQLWNSLRMVDLLEALPEVDRRRIGVTGASGGGTQTFLLTAVDERLKVSAPVNMISASMQGGDPCEEAPGLRLDTNNVEIAAMMAPRPMLMVSASGDWTKNTPVDEYPKVRAVYRNYGAAAMVSNAHFDAGHNYNKASREAVYEFFAKHLAPRAPARETIPFDWIAANLKEDLLEMPRQKLPARALDEAGVERRWRELVERQHRFGGERLRLAFGLEPTGPVSGNTNGRVVEISPLNERKMVKALVSEGERGTVVLVHPGGAEIGLNSKEAEEWRKAGFAVLALEPFHASKERDLHRRADRWFFSYNQPSEALQVENILTALQFVRGENRGRPRLEGIGDAAIWATFAAAIAPWPVELHAKTGKFGGSDEDFLKGFFVPNVQRAGGWAMAQRLASSVR